MVIYDSIYGAMEMSPMALSILKSPEMQRLREIRLINFSSPNIASLTDVKRYSHSIGVHYLASHLCNHILADLNPRTSRALQISALIHDIATPPFGHLYEYILKSIYGYSHEHYIERIISGDYRPEKQYHQIYFGKSLSLNHEFKKYDIDRDEVIEMVMGEHPVGRILSGDIDIDNIDSVYRMSMNLGVTISCTDIIDTINSFSYNIESNKWYYDINNIDLIKRWLKLRNLVYNVLVFDRHAVSAQSMLTDALYKLMSLDMIGDEHWFYSDEDILRLMWECEETKDIIARFASGDLYECIFLGWYGKSKGDIDYHEIHFRNDIINKLSTKLNLPCVTYIFNDKNTFSKEISLLASDDPTMQEVHVGENSNSIIAGVFTPRRHTIANLRQATEKVIRVFEDSGLNAADLMSIPDNRELHGLPGQTKLQI